MNPNLTFWGFVLNILGLIVGIVGVGLAVRSHMKLKDAQTAKKGTERKLFHHMAAQQFDEIGRTAAEIILRLRGGDVRSASGLATELKLSLGKALGSWSRLMEGSERDKVEVAMKSADEILQQLPAAGGPEPIAPERAQSAVGHAGFIMAVAGEIGGRLRVVYLEESEVG